MFDCADVQAFKSFCIYWLQYEHAIVKAQNQRTITHTTQLEIANALQDFLVVFGICVDCLHFPIVSVFNIAWMYDEML